MKKFLFTISLIAALSNIAFAATVQLGNQCSGAGCAPSDDGTLHGEAEIGKPITSYKFTCEWRTNRVESYNNWGKRKYYKE